MASSEIQAAYTALTDGVAILEEERLLVKSLIEREFAHLMEQKMRASAAGIRSGPVVQNLFFRDMSQRQPVHYGFKCPSYDRLISNLRVSHNRQYQWLLVEAFELFEDFLVDAYGCAGALDLRIWTAPHLKAVGGQHGHGAAWWVAQARSLRRSPSAKTVLERLRLLPGVRRIEESNAHGIDYKLAFLMIERMRHVIVHNRGRVASKEKFAAAILSDAGSFSGGKPRAEDARFIWQYFGDGKLNTTILLLEHNLPPNGPFRERIDVWGEILGWILSYAHMLSLRL